MKFHLSARAGDILLNTASAVFAFSCAVFAGHMILRLERMKDPPADLGLDFSAMDAARRTADPMVTASIGSGASRGGATLPPLPPSAQVPVTDFRLVAVANGKALIEVAGPGRRQFWEVGEGDVLPGAGRVLRIMREGGAWHVSATYMTIAGERR